MANRFNILCLKIDDVEVERVRVFGPEHIKNTVQELKNAYHLLPHHDYEFFILHQSKMNKNISVSV